MSPGGHIDFEPCSLHYCRLSTKVDTGRCYGVLRLRSAKICGVIMKGLCRYRGTKLGVVTTRNEADVSPTGGTPTALQLFCEFGAFVYIRDHSGLNVFSSSPHPPLSLLLRTLWLTQHNTKHCKHPRLLFISHSPCPRFIRLLMTLLRDVPVSMRMRIEEYPGHRVLPLVRSRLCPPVEGSTGKNCLCLTRGISVSFSITY